LVRAFPFAVRAGAVLGCRRLLALFHLRHLVLESGENPREPEGGRGTISVAPIHALDGGLAQVGMGTRLLGADHHVSLALGALGVAKSAFELQKSFFKCVVVVRQVLVRSVAACVNLDVAHLVSSEGVDGVRELLERVRASIDRCSLLSAFEDSGQRLGQVVQSVCAGHSGLPRASRPIPGLVLHEVVQPFGIEGVDLCLSRSAVSG